MQYRWVGLFCLCWLLLVSQAFAAEKQELEVSVNNPGARVQVDRMVEEGKLVVSVDDVEQRCNAIDHWHNEQRGSVQAAQD